MKNLLLIVFILMISMNKTMSQADTVKLAMNNFSAKAPNGDVSEANINVWPNPAIGYVNIYINSIQPGDKGQGVVFNTAGKPCLVNYLRNGNNQLYVGNLPEGLYFIKIILHNDILFTKKLMIAH